MKAAVRPSPDAPPVAVPSPSRARETGAEWAPHPTDLQRLPLEVPRPRRSRVFAGSLRSLVPVGVIVAWQIAVSQQSGVGYKFPAPAAVLQGFVQLWQIGDIQAAIPISVQRAGLGLLFGVAIGLTLGIANGLVRFSENLTDLPMQIIRTIPFVAAVPLFLVWFGTGEVMKVIVITLASTYPVYINAFSAVKNVDRRLLEVGETFRLSRLGIVVQIVLPAALPSILVGLRYAMGAALTALVVAEQVNSREGIGYIVYSAQNAFRVDLMMVGISIYALLGILVDLVMRLLERALLPWVDRRKR